MRLHLANYGVGGYMAGGQHTFPAPAPIYQIQGNMNLILIITSKHQQYIVQQFLLNIIQMSEELLKIYCKRLDNLSDLLSQIHKIVGVDECLTLLNDEKLIQYKIDRVNELIKQILQSEKQKIIIQLINRLDKLQHISTSKMQKQQEQFFKKMISQKNNEVQNVKLQLKLLTKQKEEQKKIYSEQRQQFALYKQKYKIIEEKHDKLFEENKLQILEYQRKNQQIQMKYRQLQKKYNEAQENITFLKKQNQNLKQYLQKQQKQNKNLLSKSKLYQYQTTIDKIQKVQMMKIQIKKLNINLNEMKEMFKIIKQNIIRSTANSLKGIKIQLKQLKQYIYRQISQFFSFSINSVRNTMKEVTLRHHRQEQNQIMIKKMQNLESQLDKFIDNKLIV